MWSTPTTVVDSRQCAAVFPDFPEDGICTRGLDKIVCEGSSGSPMVSLLQYEKTGVLTDTGVTAIASFDTTCADAAPLSVFTNLTYHTDRLAAAALCDAGRACNAGVWFDMPADPAQLRQSAPPPPPPPPPAPALSRISDFSGAASATAGLIPAVLIAALVRLALG